MPILLPEESLRVKNGLPPCGWLKVNVDSAWVNDSRRGGAGVVIRDESGAFVTAAACNFEDGGGPAHMEAMSLRFGLQLASTLGPGPFLFECDSLCTVNALAKPSVDRSFVGPVVDDCKHFLGRLPGSRVVFAPRCCNRIADRLAKFGAFSDQSWFWHEDPPYFIGDLLTGDSVSSSLS